MSGAILGVMVTLLVSIGSYVVSARVSAERREMEWLAQGNRALLHQIRTLDQELRVRMRLPQLQSWNDSTLRMQPATARQLLGGTAELALYALEKPAPTGPVLVAAEQEPPLRLPALPMPSPQPGEESLEASAPTAAAAGLILASLSAVLDAEREATAEDAGLLPGEALAAHAPQPVAP
ncbi:hypothetical protein [Thermaurantiacus sp.]